LEDDVIEAELARDDTATGRRQAAVARAARPTPVAKELAWAEVIDRTDAPNAILEATMAGFMQPEQIELLVAYRDRYFEDLPRVWRERTNETASSITMGLFPTLLIEQETIDVTNAFLATSNAASDSPAGRRLLIESRDGIERSMRARKKDAAS
jgi:aminopeptidase N